MTCRTKRGQKRSVEHYGDGNGVWNTGGRVLRVWKVKWKEAWGVVIGQNTAQETPKQKENYVGYEYKTGA